MEWRLLDLGMKDGYFIQSVYEAVAKAVTEKKSPNTIILVSPAFPYVCIGVHQELEKEVDVHYSEAHSIPIINHKGGEGVFLLKIY